ncbi:MAG: hypothetical protein PVJ42_08125 [bacterium]|jgi:hypothetical protein
MTWYWWILVGILGLNVFAIAMLGVMMISDWFAQRRGSRHETPPHEDESEYS